MKQTKESAVFADFIGQHINGDEERAAFERDVLKLMAQSKVLNALDAIREEEGVTKKEVADRIGTKPSVVSRLFSGKAANPTLSTLADVADALGVYFELKIKHQPKAKAKKHPPIEVYGNV